MTKAPAKRPGRSPAAASTASDIAAFLDSARRTAPGQRGRLIFALDATMSRQPTWDIACDLQSAMFEAAGQVGGLDVQLVYFRGHGESRASRWVSDGATLADLMGRIDCRGGRTQIGRVLDHARKAAEAGPLSALVYVGDCMEESPDILCDQAGALGLLGVRAFMFHEGADPPAAACFREIARLTGGVYLPFDRNAAAELRDLLAAVATYAAGGRPALEADRGRAARRLLTDLR